jgi:Zn-dependent metalloprotease
MTFAATSRGKIALWGAVLLMTVASGSAWAFTEDPNLSALNIPLPAERDVPVWTTMTAAESPFTSAANFEASLGTQWNYWWNEATGTPHQVWGPGYQASAGFVLDAEQAESIAREFIRSNAGLFGTDGYDLVLKSASNGMGKWGLVFDQVHEGIPVVGGRAHVVMTESGRIYNFGSDVYRGIEISLNPVMSSLQAVGAAQQAIGFVEGRDKVMDEGSLVIVPDHTGGVVTYHLAYENKLEVSTPFGKWKTTVDANTGNILGRWNEVQFFDYFGNTRGDIEDHGYCDGEQDRAVPNQYISVTGVGQDISDANGDFSLSSATGGDRDISAELRGPWLNVNNYAGSDAVFNGTISADTFFQMFWADFNAQDDERCTYLTGNRAHDTIKWTDPDLTQADYSMPANVSRNATCNAYWDGNSINFYREGGGCGNTGRMGDVVYHEYAHGITQWTYGSNTCDNGESGSDTFMMMVQDADPIVGEGFYLNNCTSGIRTCDNNYQYPDDYGSSCHFNGQIICGVWWDTWQELLGTMSPQEVKEFLLPLWHYSRKNTHPNSFPDQVLAIFVTDDDDGNLDNGTPHYDEICVGATNHGFDCPEILVGVIIQHAHLDCTEEENVPFDVEATIFSTVSTIDPSTAKLYYSIDGGGFTEVPMLDQGSDIWAAQIPGQTQPTDINYYISAEDLVGNANTWPADAPTVTQHIAVADLYDPFEAPSGWTVGDVDDNASSGVWVRVDPAPTSAQPGDDYTTEGTFCWVTGQHTGGGDGANDVDDGKTTLFSPAYDLTGATEARAYYHKWYSNSEGNAPNSDTWLVQARNNGGAWVDVENTMVSTNAWVEFQVDLLDLFGGSVGTVEFKFVASDEGSGSLVEAAVDDLCLLVTQGSAGTGDVGRRLAYRLNEATPNPFNPQTTIRFEVPERVQASLVIYSVDGRMVRNLLDNTVEPGGYTLAWDSRDDAGRSVSAGVYYYVLEAGSFRSTRQMVLLK